MRFTSLTGIHNCSGIIHPTAFTTHVTIQVDFRLSETVPLHPDAIDSDLSTVGLLPAPRGSGEDSRTAAEGGCDPNGCLSFYAKVGEMCMRDTKSEKGWLDAEA